MADQDAAAAPAEGGDAPEMSLNQRKKLEKKRLAEEKKKAKKKAAMEAKQAGGSDKDGDGDKKKGGDKESKSKGDGDNSGGGGGGEQFSFPKAEEEMLVYWDKINAFETSVKFSEGNPEFTFYDGPPFATGKPHYGHILAGTIKDVVCRYAHQTGHYVERKFGWDTHGLPVEYEIDKTHNITGPADVEAMGIDKYNELCRGIVMRYSGEWREVVRRLGRWIDFENDYKTLYPWFMESVWWVFSELFKKDLVYRGFRVMPFSTALATPLSNFEANQEFHETKDPWAIANFPVKGEDNTFFVAWTTTPWTLPSNLALCVNPGMEYCRVKDAAKGCIYILMKARICGKGCLYSEKDKAAQKFEIIETFQGATLVGMRYEPLFPFFVDKLGETAWRVVADDYVTNESGVGVVHQAPAFGEDDYRVCIREGIIDVTNVPCPVDDSGRFTAEVTDYAGMYVKDADNKIMQDLGKAGRLVSKGNLTHRDAFCWRSGTRLMRKAVDSWFVKVTDIVPDLLTSNDATYWVPESVKEKRFRNWLENARDWNISRNRYWGTPIPLWVSDDYEEVVCISSIAELEELSGVKGITDLHRESIDHITIPSKQGKGDLKRVKQVFDCWFESGSMPYASRHYPFERKERFEQTFPADFIAEGLDQTRGWFYTLTVLGTALFGKSPFKNLIVNGLVLAADGTKMSKSKKNFPDPTLVIDKYGSDALRCYLMNSPVVHAQELAFKEEGIQQNLKDLFLPWLNALRFFTQSADEFASKQGVPFVFDCKAKCPSSNVTDRWLLAFAQDMIKHFHTEMKAYRLYTVIPKLFGFVEQLTNWYIRFNRKRLKGDPEEARLALWCLGEVLYTQSLIMSPFAPFFSEWSYLKLRPYIKGANEPATASAAPAPGIAAEVAGWSAEQVAQWIAGNPELNDFSSVFSANKMTGQDLLDLNHADLQSMQVESCSDRKKILRETAKLGSTADGGEPVGTPEPTIYDSIHFQMLPQPNPEYYDDDIVRSFEVMKSIVNSGRIIRDRATIPIKYPLRELVVISKSDVMRRDAEVLQTYIEEELNIQMFTVTPDEDKYNVQVRAQTNNKVLGKRLRGDAKKVAEAVSKMTKPEIEEFQRTGTVEVLGHTLSADTKDIEISYDTVNDGVSDSKYMANVDLGLPELVVLLDCAPSETMLMEGTAREICSNVQKLRKEAKLTPKDSIRVHLRTATDTATTKLETVLKQFAGKMSDDLKAEVSLEAGPEGGMLIESLVDIGKDGAQVNVGIVRL